ncbi:TonB-dependent receptor [Verrucomicrobium sp. BvORR106]|uniref:TonB-dependent siderophore receptor n=1 Tax=Verrucomicrobium sp. BvORR106 TaxID=1403819 RepID=UPI00056DA441|nr:TonB-dependent receptor [Verrucomicrobium sp. BvORR106]
MKPELLLEFDTGPVKHHGLLGFNYLITYTETLSQDGFDLRPIDFRHPVYGLPPIKRPPADPSDPTSIPAGARDFRLSEELEEYGVYYQHKLDISERVHLLGGVRYDWYEDDIAFTRNVRTSPLDPVEGFSDQNLSWRAGAVVDVLSNVSLFAGYSNSFQPQSGLLSNGSFPDALEATSFEAGLKGSFFNNRLQASLSVYETERKNLLESDPTDPTFTFVVPLGTVRVRGLEYEMTGKITEDLDIQGGIAFMDSEITETLDPLTKGKEFYNVPNTQAGLRLRYDTSRWLLKGLSLGAGVIYVGERAGDATNSFALPDYWRFDAGLYYQWRNWNFKLTCQNVTDETYYLATQGFADIVQPGAPRIVTFGVEVKF